MNDLCSSGLVHARYNPEFKQNWRPFFARMAAWWEGTLVSPIVRVAVANGHGTPETPPDDTDWEARANDTEHLIRYHEDAFRSTRFLTDMAPCVLAHVGHGIPSFLGCPLAYLRETVWTHPCLNAIGDPFDVTRWRTDVHWNALTQRVRQLTAHAALRYGVSYYLGGVFQGMAMMRGDAALLMDLLDHPCEVEALRDRLLPQWFDMAEELEALLPVEAGRWGPFALWAPDRLVFCECDVSCNVSPAQFGRFVVPELLAMTQWARYSIYHLDGPSAVHHLDALLEIPGLDAVQWIRGDGGGNALDWLPLLHRIQGSGKRLYVECPPSELRELLAALDPQGLFVAVESPRDRAETQLAMRIAAEHGADQETDWAGTGAYNGDAQDGTGPQAPVPAALAAGVHQTLGLAGAAVAHSSRRTVRAPA